MLYAEPLEPKKLTVEQAFEAGKAFVKGNKDAGIDYDAAGRQAARLCYEAAKTNPELNRTLHEIENLDSKALGHSKWEHELFALMERFPQLNGLGLSAFQASWAIQAAAKALIESETK